jgi:hypothetical protein
MELAEVRVECLAQALAAMNLRVLLPQSTRGLWLCLVQPASVL